MPRSPPELGDHVTLASKYIGVLYEEKSKKYKSFVHIEIRLLINYESY